MNDINYVRHDLGPVPKTEAYKIIYEAEFGKVKAQQQKNGAYIQNSHYATSEPDYSISSPEATDIIKEVTEMVQPFSVTKLPDLTHNEIWTNTKS